MRRILLLGFLSTTACVTAPPPPPPPAVAEAEPAPAPAPVPAFAYPSARRGDLTEDDFGVAVADPYRWLENDVRNDAEVRTWVTAENEVTDSSSPRCRSGPCSSSG